MVKKPDGYVCDKCRKFFTHEALIVKGKKRDLHFCSLRCKGNYLKKKNGAV